MAKGTLNTVLKRSSNLAQALQITAVWIAIGLAACSFEILIIYSYAIQHDHFITFIIYVIPPVLFGFPFALLEVYYFKGHKTQWTYRKAMLFKGVVYFLGIAVVYLLLGKALSTFYSGNLEQWIGAHFIIKFMIIWGIAVILTLLFTNLYYHFDPTTFRYWLTGKYHQPIEETRIFLFLDINDSTGIAESLGSNRYFALLHDFHQLVEDSLVKHQGELYQYAGDEVIITWSLSEGLRRNNAIELFFDLERAILSREQYFKGIYGAVPYIKGSLHSGDVTRGEMGMMKKDFTFTGDVLNTAARMYNLCKEINAPLVISRMLLSQFKNPDRYVAESHGYFTPRGKQEKIFIYTLKRRVPFKSSISTTNTDGANQPEGPELAS